MIRTDVRRIIRSLETAMAIAQQTVRAPSLAYPPGGSTLQRYCRLAPPNGCGINLECRASNPAINRPTPSRSSLPWALFRTEAGIQLAGLRGFELPNDDVSASAINGSLNRSLAGSDLLEVKWTSGKNEALRIDEDWSFRPR
jgi:hypothetical protein